MEYTSEAFLSQLHTMATYTRCSDSVLCAPLSSTSVVCWTTSRVKKCRHQQSRRRRLISSRCPRAGLVPCRRLLGAATGAGTGLDGHDDVQAVILKMMMLSVSCAAASRVWIWSCLEPQDLGREAINAFGEASSRGRSAPTASCLADHGVPTTVVAALGDDQQGDELRALLTERGVAVDETLSEGGRV